MNKSSSSTPPSNRESEEDPLEITAAMDSQTQESTHINRSNQNEQLNGNQKQGTEISLVDFTDLPLDFTDLLQEADEQLQQLMDNFHTFDDTIREEDTAAQAVLSTSGTSHHGDTISKRNTVKEISIPNNNNIHNNSFLLNDSSLDMDVDPATTPRFISTNDLSTSAIDMITTPCSSGSTPLTSNVVLTAIGRSDGNDIPCADPSLQSQVVKSSTVVVLEEESPEKSFLWYYPKSLFITTSSESTTAAYTIKNKWWWTSGTTTMAKDDVWRCPQDVNDSASAASNRSLRKELEHALERGNNSNKHDYNNKLLLESNNDTGCTAIQLGEETFRITITVPETSVSNVMNRVSDPNNLEHWCDAVLSTSNTTRSSSNTTDRFDAEWFESVATLRSPGCWMIPWTKKKSSKLTLFTDHRRSRISITYILGGCEVHHTFTFSQVNEDKDVHVKDTLRVIPIELSSSTANCLLVCLRPCIRNYCLPNVRSHMKQAMTSLENLQRQQNQLVVQEENDLTTPLLS